LNPFVSVGRATGNQRVCVNSKIFPEMLVEKMTDKRLKISALNPESDAPQLIVVNASPAAIVSLQRQLEILLTRSKNAQSRKRPLDSEVRDESEVSKKERGDKESDESADSFEKVDSEDKNTTGETKEEDSEDSE
jgi:hypothetical protein